MAEPFRCGLILLAAGASRRMGRPKQLLPVAGQPLLRQVAERLLVAPVAPVVVVLGANADAIAPCLDGLALTTVVNERWDDGMGSSLGAGLQALLRRTPPVDAVIVALADQPQSSAEHLAALLQARTETGRSIVATTSAGVPQPPALFTAEWFPRLLALKGDAGARRLLQENAGRMATVARAAIADLDTPADYEDYLGSATK